MTTVTIEEAQARLPELVEKAVAGEQVVIERGGGRAVRLTPAESPREIPAPRRPGTGASAILHMSDDFDAPLEDFEEYMR